MQGIARELNTTPFSALECIKNLPKAQDMADLQARVDCLLRENGELRSQAATREAQLKEMEALKAVAFEESMRVQEDLNKANAISLKFHNFVGHPGNVVNKVQLHNESTCQPGALPASKVI